MYFMYVCFSIASLNKCPEHNWAVLAGLAGTVGTKDYIEQIDVQSQINQPKELPKTGHFCIQLRQSARKHTLSTQPQHATV